MQAFKVGIRHNNIDGQICGVARWLTGNGLAILATYYWTFADTTGR
jgi:hypothetical protein